MPLNFFTILITFLQAGGLTIGDGYAVIAPLRRALVKKNGWTDEDDFSRQLAVAQAMPGIFNVNMAAYMGWRLMGWKGSAAALLGMTLPPLVIFTLFATFYTDMCQLPWLSKLLRGMRPAIVAIVALPCLQMWRKSQITISTIWIPIGAAIAIGLFGISPTYIILGLTLIALLYAVFVSSTGDEDETH